jgi:hypothetical protein
MQTIDSVLKFEQMRWNKIECVRMISSQKNIHVSKSVHYTDHYKQNLSKFLLTTVPKGGALACWRLMSLFSPEMTPNSSHRLFISASHNTLATFCCVAVLLSLPEPTQGHHLARAGEWCMDKNFKTFPFSCCKPDVPIQNIFLDGIFYTYHPVTPYFRTEYWGGPVISK